MKGGKREGAGRKPGTPNKRTTGIISAIEAGGEMPLERILKRMRDKKLDDRIRDDLAVKAAPYCHPRLQSTEVSGPEGGPIEHNITDKRNAARVILDILRQAQLEETRK
jgi:hypothetical protein